MKNYFKKLCIVAVFVIFSYLAYSKDDIVDFYYQVGCRDCDYLKEKVIPDLQKTGCIINEYDLGQEEYFLQLLDTLMRANNLSNESTYLIINKKNILAGYEQIVQWSQAYISNDIENDNEHNIHHITKISEEILRQRAEQLTWFTIAWAGLLDGINPCVFSTLIFFLSLLLTLKIKRSKFLLIGGCYCFACFLTYLVLGFGLFKFLKIFLEYSYFSDLFEVSVALILLCLAFISFRDAFYFKKTRSANVVILQLPYGIKTTIHMIMRKWTTYRHLVPGAFIIGSLVTILEGACTGQVYVPVLALMLKKSSIESRWIFYLLLYNFMFIIPLIFLFVAVSWGSTTSMLLKWSRGNVVIAKIALGIIFIVLAGLIIML